MNHIDLFSGIGGFAYAFREVFPEGRTILFCDNDKYCQAVLRRHWPESEIWGDIRELIANAKSGRERNSKQKGDRGRQPQEKVGDRDRDVDILTGGFPCQPFSQAGKRRGKSDDRFLWPEMLECIRLFQPSWVIAENVYGILSIEGGLVFEQVCSGMEEAGYKVWPFIVPACAVNAPHRRDRVWIVAHKQCMGWAEGTWKEIQPDEQIPEGQGFVNSSGKRADSNPKFNGCLSRGNNRGAGHFQGAEIREAEESEQTGHRWLNRSCKAGSDAPNSHDEGLQGYREYGECGRGRTFRKSGWQADWREVAVATCVCGVDDGVPLWMDGVRISRARQRKERLKMLGNAIVPQVAVEIMKAIRYCKEKGE